MSAFFLSLSIWDWFDLIGLLLVFVGVAGEILIPRIRFRISRVSELKWAARVGNTSLVDALSEVIEMRKAVWLCRMHCGEIASHVCLAVGLALELVALPHHFIEAGELKERAAVAELELTKIKEQRTITKEQREKFISMMRDQPKGPVGTYTAGARNETGMYQTAIRYMLDQAGYGGENLNGFWVGATFTPISNSTVRIIIKQPPGGLIDFSKLPPFTLALYKAFAGIGVNAEFSDAGRFAREGGVDIFILDK